MKNKIFITLLLALIMFQTGCSEIKKALPKKKIPYKGADKIDFKINPMMELDFKKKSEVYDIRKKYVNEYPELAKYLAQGEYKPSEEVFGQIQDGKSWWGILGICYYGNGKKSIEGPSEETRFLCNPYLIIGLCELYARHVNDPSLKPKAIYATPESCCWDMKNREILIKYNVSDYLKEAKKYHYPGPEKMYLVAYNAKDLGFKYFYILPGGAENIKFEEQKEARVIPQYIHVGGSSGYPGGSNNMSPAFKPLDIEVEKTPAKVTVKLWKEMPKNIEAKCDMTVVLEME